MVKRIGLFLLSLILVVTMMPLNILVDDVFAASAYYVVFDGNGATSGSMTKQTVYVGVSQPLTKNAFKKTNDTFQGWNTKRDGSGTSFSDGASVKNLTSAGNVVTLYAQWRNGSSGSSGGTQSGSVVVTYNGNGASSGSMSSQTLTNGEGKLSKNRFTRTNASFLGWSTSKTATKPTYYDGEYVALKSSVTLYAVWSGVSNVTVTFIPNGATGNSYTQTMQANSLTYLDANKFSRSGYTFQGWSNKADGNVIYIDKQKASFSSNVNLFAIWKKSNVGNVTVSFDGNGATSGSNSNQVLTNGEGKLGKCLFKRTGYAFIGWSTSKTATQGTYADGEYVKFSKNITLYAVWKKSATLPSSSGKKAQTIRTSFERYQFIGVNKSVNLNAKASSGLKCIYKSADSKIATVDGNGKITAKKAGTTKITISQNGNGSYNAKSKVVVVQVPGVQSRDSALKPWYNALEAQIKWQKNAKYNWDKWRKKGGDVAASKYYGTCITLPSAALQRAGLLVKGGFVAGVTSKSNRRRAVKYMNKNPGYITSTDVNSTVKKLASKNKIQKGDIVHSNNHTWVYMGRSSKKGKFIAWECGNSSKNSNKANKNNSKSGTVKLKWVNRINCYNVNTICVNGTITGSNLYMAGQTIKVTYKPINGKKLKSIKVDGKAVSVAKYGTTYTFTKLNKNHTVEVIFN